MPKRYDRTLGWVEDSLGLAHSRELDAWVRGDGVVRFKDGRVLTLDSLQGEEAKQAREAQRRAAKLQKTVTPQLSTPAPTAPPAGLPRTTPGVPAGNPPPRIAKLLGLPSQEAPGPSAAPRIPQPPQRPASQARGGLDSFAALLRGGS